MSEQINLSPSWTFPFYLVKPSVSFPLCDLAQDLYPTYLKAIKPPSV